jgi:hypothetical protein
VPDVQGLPPAYAERRIPDEEKQGRLRLIISGDGRDDSIAIHQDVDLYAAVLKPGEVVEHRFAPDRNGWIQIVRGTAAVSATELVAGDGAAIVNEDRISIRGVPDTEILLFDMV